MTINNESITVKNILGINKENPIYSILNFKFFILLCSSFFLTSCGHWGWEDVESDYKSELNVIGFISSYTTIPSRIIVEKTLGLDEPTSVWVEGTDTVWYGEGPEDYYLCCGYRKSLYGIDSADVIVSDGVTDYHFHPLTNIEEDDWRARRRFNWYYDTTNTFQPQPETTYNLTVTTPDNMVLTGEVTTPSQVEIIDDYEHTPDTLNAGIPFGIHWQNYDGHGYVSVNPVDSWFCGMHFKRYFSAGETQLTTPHENCLDDLDDYYDPDTVMIEVIGMDENYHNYFVKYSGEDDFVDFILGGGSSGDSFGVQGGLGVFGAITVDRIYRIMKP